MFRDWKSILGVLAVFILGGVAGLLLSFIVVRHRVTELLRPGSPAYEQMLERRLSRGLHLDAGQRERFHEALIANIEARKKLQVQLQPQMQELNLETRRQLAIILTPEQRATFRQNMEEFRRRFGMPGLGVRGAERAAAEDNAPAASTNTPPGAD